MPSMHPLNISRIAFGCNDADILRARLTDRAEQGETSIVTRYRPTRHTELVGGSLFWIIKHQLVVRNRILGFAESEEGKCRIRLDAACVPLRVRPRRAHQGWRYLEGKDAPPDLDGEIDELGALPASLALDLAALALI